MAVSVFAPASIGNVSVGFDILGLAVKPVDGTLLGDVVDIECADENALIVAGKFADKLPSDPKENIVWQCLELFNQALIKVGIEPEPVKMTLNKKMPVGSGLGSSACSVVAAIFGLDAFYKKQKSHRFSSEVLLKMMGQMEAKISGSLHYDNVAPCFLGGLQLMVADENIIARTLPSFEDCYFVMAYPGIEVSTKAAREVLPHDYSKQTLIQFGQNLATFVDGCHRQDKHQAFSVVKDIVAEPFRKDLLPGFENAKSSLMEQGALAVGISGSGPTLFCAIDNAEKANKAAQWLKDNYLITDLGFVHVCKADKDGATELPLQ